MPKIFDSVEFKSGAVEIDNHFLKSIKKCLVLSPHPDDESLGCGGLIAHLRENDCEVKIILTTDGSKSHPNSKQYPAEKLSALRRQEIIKALYILGVESDQISFYNGLDSALPAFKEEGFNDFADHLLQDIAAFQPNLVLVPYELDPHRDHRATWQMLNQALSLFSLKLTVWEYPIWLYQNAAADDIPELTNGELKYLNISAYAEKKNKAIYAHVSQTTKLINDDPDGFMLSPEMILNFTSGKEYFMERSKLNGGTTLPQHYFDNLYAENPDPWDFEKSEYEKEKYLKTIAAIPNKSYATALEIGCSIGVLTKMLATKCEKLLSIDISELALDMAKNRLKGNPNVEFKLAGIPSNFPEGERDLIVMSEVGYYLSIEDLKRTIRLIEQNLNVGGILILVHWTHFVKDYPLSGDQVHDCFAKSALTHLEAQHTKDYRLDVFQKSV